MATFTRFDGIALDARNRTLANMRSRALMELGLPTDQLTIRNARPEDYGLSPSNAGEFTFNLSSTGNNTIVNNTTIADNRFVSIYGVKLTQSAAQSSVQLVITRAGQDVRYWNVQGTALTEDSMIFFEDPVTIGQNESLTIVCSAVSTNSTEKLCFLGDVVEKKGLLVYA